MNLMTITSVSTDLLASYETVDHRIIVYHVESECAQMNSVGDTWPCNANAQRQVIELQESIWAMRYADWVWRWAYSIVRRRGVPDRLSASDEVVEAAQVMLRMQRGQLPPDSPEQEAHDIYRHRRSPLVRDMLEARILTGLDDGSIAAMSGLHPRTVELYERNFFTVRSRLKARGWIVNIAIFRNQTTNDWFDIGTILKRAGYFGGILALDNVYRVFCTTKDLIRDPLPDLMTVEGRLTLLTRMYLLIESSPLTSLVLGIVQSWKVLIEQGKRRAESLVRLERTRDELRAPSLLDSSVIDWQAIGVKPRSEERRQA